MITLTFNGETLAHVVAQMKAFTAALSLADAATQARRGTAIGTATKSKRKRQSRRSR